VHPEHQQRGYGNLMIQAYLIKHQPDFLAVNTRSKITLDLLKKASGLQDVLDPQVLIPLPGAQIGKDWLPYDMGRYPDDLYGESDPALLEYNGQPLMERAINLRDPRNALSLAVPLHVPHGEDYAA
jgi:hypothetical protein